MRHIVGMLCLVASLVASTAWSMPTIQVKQTKQGIPIIHVGMPDSPVHHIRIVYPDGEISIPRALQAQVITYWKLASELPEGFNRDEMVELIDEGDAELSCSMGLTSTVCYGESVGSVLPLLKRALSQVSRRSEFAPTDVEFARETQLRRLRIQGTVDRGRLELLYGDKSDRISNGGIDDVKYFKKLSAELLKTTGIEIRRRGIRAILYLGPLPLPRVLKDIGELYAKDVMSELRDPFPSELRKHRGKTLRYSKTHPKTLTVEPLLEVYGPNSAPAEREFIASLVAGHLVMSRLKTHLRKTFDFRQNLVVYLSPHGYDLQIPVPSNEFNPVLEKWRKEDCARLDPSHLVQIKDEFMRYLLPKHFYAEAIARNLIFLLDMGFEARQLQFVAAEITELTDANLREAIRAHCRGLVVVERLGHD